VQARAIACACFCVVYCMVYANNTQLAYITTHTHYTHPHPHTHTTYHIYPHSHPTIHSIKLSIFLVPIKMAKSNTMQDRLRVVELHGAGLSTRAIAASIHKTQRYVNYWVRRYQLEGSVENKPRIGRPRILTDPMIRKIARHMGNKQYQSVRRTSAELRAGGINISNTSVWRGVRQAGLRAKVKRKAPLLTQKFRTRRLKFARKYKDHNWHKHMFADEKTFCLFSLPNKKNDVVWASKGDYIEPVSTVRNAAKINAYGAISLEGKTSIHLFKENMTADIYCDILRDTLLPTTNRLYGNRSWTYVQDNDPKHTARTTQQFIANNLSNTIPVEDWPPNSPDLNPIENLWATVGEIVAKQKPTNLTSMKKYITKAWNTVATADIRKKLIDSIPFRLKEVIKKKGGHTNY
jgi:transposase